MVRWGQLAEEAPDIAKVFESRLAAAGDLVLLATIRSDGYPRLSPIEVFVFEDELVVVGMPGTTKFQDLERDTRFGLHTATVDPHLEEGDVKLFADARRMADVSFHERFAQDLYERKGFDLRGGPIHPFLVADIVGASSIELRDNQLIISIWRPGEGVRQEVKT